MILSPPLGNPLSPTCEPALLFTLSGAITPAIIPEISGRPPPVAVPYSNSYTMAITSAPSQASVMSEAPAILCPLSPISSLRSSLRCLSEAYTISHLPLERFEHLSIIIAPPSSPPLSSSSPSSLPLPTRARAISRRQKSNTPSFLPSLTVGTQLTLSLFPPRWKGMSRPPYRISAGPISRPISQTGQWMAAMTSSTLIG